MRMYKRLVVFSSVVVLVIMAWGSAQGAVVTFNRELFTTNTVVINHGTLVEAVNLGAGSDVTVNGVTFATDAGKVFVSGADYYLNAYYTGSNIGSLSAADANNLLDHVEYGAGANNDLFRLTGLTVGEYYTIQMIYCFANSGGNINFAYSDPVGGSKSSWHTVNHAVASVVSGTFCATQTTQDVHVADGGSMNSILGAYQLRNTPRSTTSRENWKHTMAAGSFGLAFVDDDGDVWISNGSRPPVQLQTEGTNVSRILSADITGSVDDELVYLADPTNALYYYNFDTEVTSGPYGSDLTDLTSVFWAAGDNKMSVIAVNGTDVYKFVPNSFTTLGGSLSWVMRGDFTVGDNTDEFIGISSSSTMFTYDTETAAYRTIGGAGHRVAVPGNIDTNEVGDEVFMNYASDSKWYVVEVETSVTVAYNNLGGGGSATDGVATGDIDGNGVKGYLCNDTGTAIWRNTYPSSTTWQDGWAGSNTDFVDIILADLDKDGKDEVYGIRSADDSIAYKYIDGNSGFRELLNQGTLIYVQ